MKQLLVIFLASWIILDGALSYNFLGFHFGDDKVRSPRGVVKKKIIKVKPGSLRPIENNEVRDAFSYEKFMERQVVRKVPQSTKANNGTIHVLKRKNPNMPQCIFDGPFLSVCYSKKPPVCRQDESTCKLKDANIFCCYKPLCDIFYPTTTAQPTKTSTILPTSTTTTRTTTLPSVMVDVCKPRGNYILACTEPNKIPVCPTDVGEVIMCKVKTFYAEAFCCYKEVVINNSTTISPEIITSVPNESSSSSIPVDSTTENPDKFSTTSIVSSTNLNTNDSATPTDNPNGSLTTSNEPTSTLSPNNSPTSDPNKVSTTTNPNDSKTSDSNVETTTTLDLNGSTTTISDLNDSTTIINHTLGSSSSITSGGSTQITTESTTTGAAAQVSDFPLCQPQGNFLMTCAFPKRFPRCETSDLSITLCRVKTFTQEYVLCCYKQEIPSDTTTVDSINSSSTTTTYDQNQVSTTSDDSTTTTTTTTTNDPNKISTTSDVSTTTTNYPNKVSTTSDVSTTTTNDPNKVSTTSDGSTTTTNDPNKVSTTTTHISTTSDSTTSDSTENPFFSTTAISSQTESSDSTTKPPNYLNCDSNEIIVFVPSFDAYCCLKLPCTERSVSFRFEQRWGKTSCYC